MNSIYHLWLLLENKDKRLRKKKCRRKFHRKCRFMSNIKLFFTQRCNMSSNASTKKPLLRMKDFLSGYSLLIHTLEFLNFDRSFLDSSLKRLMKWENQKSGDNTIKAVRWCCLIGNRVSTSLWSLFQRHLKILKSSKIC